MAIDSQGGMADPVRPDREIIVWMCGECGYWRKEESTGVHQTSDPDHPRGRMVIHELHAARYLPLAAFTTLEQQRDEALEIADGMARAPYGELSKALKGRDAALAALDGLAADNAPADREEMACDRCRRYHGVVWFAPSDVWNKVMRDGDRANADEYSFCCPICFIQLAEERGINPTSWQVAPEDTRLTAADIALEATREALRQMHFHEAESDAQEFCQKIIALAAGSVAPPDDRNT